MHNYIVDNASKPITIGEWFSLFHLGKSKINYYIENGFVYADGTLVKNKSFVVNPGMVVSLTEEELIDYPGVRYNLDILYEDEWILAVNKPYGVIIYPENKIKDETLANFVAYYYEKTNQSIAIRHLYRIDKLTTGVVLYAKDALTHAYFSYQLENHEIKKQYLAIVKGKIDKNGEIKEGISRDRHNAKKMICLKNGLPSLTKYYPIISSNEYSLLEVNIPTGRTHQIRVHMAYIKHPVVGDILYGNEEDENHLMLHCSKIGFYHPMKRSYINIECEMPVHMNEFIEGKMYEKNN